MTSRRNRRRQPARVVQPKRIRESKSARMTLYVAVIGGIATITGATIAATVGTSATASPATTASPAATASSGGSPLIPGDDSTFIGDVTYPDMSKVTTGQNFVKKWELENTGSVRWVGRYLAASGQAEGGCTYPARVPIATTNPGHTVIISVPVTAPGSPQLCYVMWKMETAGGVPYFPGFVGIWFEVRIVDGTS
jgi:hypothetical protein